MREHHSFSDSLSAIRLSPIVAISELVRDRAVGYRETTGEDFVYFQRGEIAFPTPQYIVDAAAKALAEGKTRYPRSGGEEVLKQAIANKLERFNGAKNIGSENILVTYGGQEALQLAFKLFEFRSGAGFGPCWSCVLENFVPYCEIDFSLVALNPDFSVNWEALEARLKQVEFFYLNSPQNPTGKVFTEAEVRRISDLCKHYNVYLISDEAYEMITYDGARHFSPLALDGDHIIACYTFSKAYAMTGWRVGYMVCRDPELIRLCRMGDYSQTAGVVTFVQYAAAEAISNLEAEQKALAPMMQAYAERRDRLYELLSGIDGIEINKPEGAFYFFPSFSKWIPGNLEGAARNEYVFQRLLENGVAAVYGACFGDEFADHVRISFSCTDLDQIEAGIQRLKAALATLPVQV